MNVGLVVRLVVLSGRESVPSGAVWVMLYLLINSYSFDNVIVGRELLF